MLYLLTQKLPNCIFAAYVDKPSVAEMWAGIILEFLKKSILMKVNLCAKFTNMRYEKGANLQTEFSRVKMKYAALLNVGIKISKEDYSLLILNFVPRDIAAHLVNVSAGMKAHTIVSATDKEKEIELSLDAGTLMQFALEEWDCRAPAHKAREKQKDTLSSSTALVMVSSEKPGAKAGGGDKKKHFFKQGKCWNCGEKGHKKDTCTKPKQESDGNKNTGQQGSNSNKGKNSSGLNNMSGSSSKNGNTNTAVDENNVDSAWVMLSPPSVEYRDVYQFLMDVDEDEIPKLEYPTSDDEGDSCSVVYLQNRHCRNKAEMLHKFNDNQGPSTDGLTINTSGRLWGHKVKAYIAKTGGKSDVAWDLYDSGASHHMLPCQEDFINFQEIAERLLMVANQQTFTATGLGKMIVSMLNGDKVAKIKLTCILYTPALGFTLISIGQIDNAGYYSTFGGGICEIQTGERQTIGIIPKSGGVYHVPHGTHIAAAAVRIKRMTLCKLHNCLGHISPRAVKDLI